MTENDNKQPHTVGRQLASGVFYTSIAKYAGIVVTLVVSGVLARTYTCEHGKRMGKYEERFVDTDTPKVLGKYEIGRAHV